MQLIKDRNILLNLFPKGGRVAELGVFTGEFSKILFETLDPSELFLVDIFPSYMTSGDKDGNNIIEVNLENYYQILVEEYKNNSKVKIIKSKTIDFLNSLDDEYLDMVYIDADHSYDGVKNDLELSYKKVKKNGIIFGHDYSNKMFPEVVKAVDNFCYFYNLKIEFLTQDGCPTFVCIKQ